MDIGMNRDSGSVNEERIETAARILRDGGVVAFPTETVYGLGADALNERAVARIFEAKKRPRFDPLIVHVAQPGQVTDLASAIPEKAKRLIARFWPGPLTLILPKKEHVPDIVTAGLSGVGIRMPAHPTALALIEKTGTPIAAPSANRFGGISPTRAEHVEAQLGDSVDLILDGGPCTVGVESTIISFMETDPLMLRPGGLPLESVEEEIGKVKIPPAGELANASPGRSGRHYAPRTALVLAGPADDLPRHPRIGLLTLIPPKSPDRFAAVEVLSPSGDLREAACNLFSAMRRLDSLGLDAILAVPVPETGLGRAINDRLMRASINAQKSTEREGE